jgi:small nuclear ribonucleoprotein G
VKVQPPELKGFMDKKLSSEFHSYENDHLIFVSFHYSIPKIPVYIKQVSRLLSISPQLFLLKLSAVKLNANRQVSGVLRGFDQFMNIVLDNTVDEKAKADLGMVVIRGNSIITIEALERIDQD